ncbi:MAG: hypothetical protein ACK4R3_08855, partial [Aliihoeflea sp.]
MARARGGHECGTTAGSRFGALVSDMRPAPAPPSRSTKGHISKLKLVRRQMYCGRERSTSCKPAWSARRLLPEIYRAFKLMRNARFPASCRRIDLSR